MLFVLDHTLPNARYIRSLIHYCLLVVNCFWFLSTNSFCESFTLFLISFQRSACISIRCLFVFFNTWCYSIFKVHHLLKTLNLSRRD